MKRADYLGWAAFNMAAAAFNLAVPSDFHWAARFNVVTSFALVGVWVWMAWRGES